MGRLKLNKKAKSFLKKSNVVGPINDPGEIIVNDERMINYYRSFEAPFEVTSSHSKDSEQIWYCCGEYHTFPNTMLKKEAYAKLLAICVVKEAPKKAIFIQNNSKEAFTAN